MMISLRKKTTKRCKKLSSNGYYAVMATLNLKLTSKKSLRSVKMLTSPISLPLLIVFAHAFKSLMTSPRTLLLFSIPSSTSSTLTLSLSLSIFTRLSARSMSPSHSSLRNSKPRCLSYRLLSFFQTSKICLLQRWTYTIWMSSLLLKRVKWLSSQTSAVMRTLSTTSVSVVTFLVLLKTLKMLTIPRQSSTIYFKRSLSTSAPIYREPARTMMLTRMHDEQGTKRATCRKRSTKMAGQKILILISRK